MEDMALQHVDDAVTTRLIEAGQHFTASLQGPERCASPGAWRRQMRRPDLGLQAVLGQRACYPRRTIVSIGGIRQMLQLAAAACREMAARRLPVAGARFERAIAKQQVTGHSEWDVTAAGRNAVASRGNSDDFFAHKTDWIAATRSSAIIEGPAASAARPCSHTPAQAASNASSPRARIAAMIPASTSPVPAVASQAGAGGAKPSLPSGEATSVSGPL